jgi:hypothetical protein
VTYKIYNADLEDLAAVVMIGSFFLNIACFLWLLLWQMHEEICVEYIFKISGGCNALNVTVYTDITYSIFSKLS